MITFSRRLIRQHVVYTEFILALTYVNYILHDSTGHSLETNLVNMQYGDQYDLPDWQLVHY